MGAAAVGRAGVALTAFAKNTPISSDAVNQNFTNLASAITALQAQVAALPPGTIVAYGGQIDKNPGEGTGAPVHPPPAGWLLCDGMQLNGLNATYAPLYAAIGVSFGGNTTSQAFNLPDLRGTFLRGVDAVGLIPPGVDPDTASRKVGSVQADAFAAHNHGGGDHTHGYVIPNYQVSVGSGPYPDGLTANAGNRLGLNTSSSGAIISTQGGAETRPKNVAVNYIVKL